MIAEDTLYKALGKRIRAIRRKAGVTQTDLAQQVGLTRTSISNIETGQQRVQIHTLYSIAEVLGLSLHEVLPSTLAEFSEGSKEKLGDLPKAEREWLKHILNREV